MTLVQNLLLVASTFAEARKLSLSRVSTIVFGDGKILQRLQDGSDLTTRRLETAMQWFCDNWPEGVDWPRDVPRPPEPTLPFQENVPASAVVEVA